MNSEPPPGDGDASNAGPAQRIVALLGVFDALNTPISILQILKQAGIARATGYPLVRALTRMGYLEQPSRGLLKLGPAARLLAFWSPKAHPARHAAPGRVCLPAAPATPAAAIQAYNGHPALLQVVDTTRFKRKPPYTIGFSNASMSNPWRAALLRSMRQQARAKAGSVSALLVRTANDDPLQQLRDIDAMVDDGAQLIIVSAALHDYAPLEEKINALSGAGIAVIAVDRSPANAGAVLSFVTASDHAIGATSARWLAEQLDGAGRVWMLSGAANTGPTSERREAAMAVFAEYPAIRIEVSTHTEWRSDWTYRFVADLLRHPAGRPDGVWCDSGLQGIGSIEAFLAAGWSGRDIPPHTGGDLNRMYRVALEQRIPLLGIDYPAAMGARALSLALACLAGHAVPRRLHTDLQCVISRGYETRSVKADIFCETHVRWDMPDDFILSHGHLPERGA